MFPAREGCEPIEALPTGQPDPASNGSSRLGVKRGQRGTDRAIQAVTPPTRPPRASLRDLARPAVIRARRIVSRTRPVMRRSAPAMALQTALLNRVDVTGYNQLGPPTLTNIQSQACSAGQVLEKAYLSWAAKIGEAPRFHRKQWEYVAILEAARQAGLLEPGRSALGFGVGTEPVPAVLASLGLSVLATDQSQDQAGRWTERSEHAADVDDVAKPWICPPAVFSDLVSFRSVDMNALPNDLGLHDLIWSACVIEHLGSPAAGLEFVVRSLDLLASGGLAVHTTELDLTPGDAPVDYGHCAVYRLQDFRELRDSIVAAGFEMSLNPYIAFEHPADRFIAPPLSLGTEEFHLKLALYDSITTSFALVIRRQG